MKKKHYEKFKVILKNKNFWIFIFAPLFLCFVFFYTDASTFIIKEISYKSGEILGIKNSEEEKEIKKDDTALPLDTTLYDKKMLELANVPPPPAPKTITKKVKDPKTGKITTTTETIPPPVRPPYPWPVKTVYPNRGAILPFNRIIAYYGNLYSTKMGVLGEYKEDVMLAKLDAEVKKWQAADPETKAIPALHYIAVVAQAAPGKDGKYRARMPDSEIDKVITMAEKINAIVFLDVQVALSNLQEELPHLEKYLKMPNVHLGIDPEFSMKNGVKPGKQIGTYDASDVNFAAEYLAKIVKENNLTPKVLVVHRFTQKMVTNYKNIKPLPEVQIVMHMDGWGGKAKKAGTYKYFINAEPVQFTGFKIFYKNDIKEKGTVIYSPEELLKLSPRPIYIQYQ